MADTKKTKAALQIDAIAKEYADLKAKVFQVPAADHVAFHTHCLATATRLCGADSVYVRQIERLLTSHASRLDLAAPVIFAVIDSLRCDIDNGFCTPKE